jgi:hypothetical protein
LDTVRDWDLYESGIRYNNKIQCINNANYYDLTDALIDFVNGNQWRNLEITGMRKPVFNIMAKALRFWVASITANNTKIDLEPLEYSQDSPNEQMNIADFASAEIANLFEKFKMDNRIREALFKAGTIGDVAAHFYFDPTKKPYGGAFSDVEGEICFELVKGTNVFFGNANNSDKETQPYIIISGRDLAENLQKEAERYKKKDDQGKVTADNDTEYEAGSDSKIEVEADGFGKATYIIVYRKKTVKDKKQREVDDGLGNITIEDYEEDRQTVMVSKCVKSGYIYQDIDTELTHYPVAWLPWERQESQYHGKPPLAEVMETQIFINIMFAFIMYHLSMTAFPKGVYDADKITGWTNRIAEAIPVRNLQPGESIRNVAGYLEPAQMSPQIVQAIQIAYDMLKDVLGVNEAVLGEINPEQASGKAILATVRQGVIPLDNPKANMYEWIEDIGIILLDMMGTYYGTRPIVMEKDGTRGVQQFDFSALKNIWLNVRVDVGTTNIWDDQARKRTAENLLMQGKIDILQFLERLDDRDIKDRQKLIDEIRQTMTDQEFIYEQMARFVETLPIEVQAQLEQLRMQNPEAFEKQVRQMMGGGGNGMPGMQSPVADIA